MKNICLIGLCLISVSCKKDWFDAKSNSALIVPGTIADFQALLDYNPVMNESTINLLETGADNYYIPYSTWLTGVEDEKNAAIWNQRIFDNPNPGSWNSPYQVVFYSNVVLDAVDNLSYNNATVDAWRNLKGCALFFRAYSFYNLAQIFANQYSDNSDDELGIPLRLSSDPNPSSVRSTVGETYRQIISDLQTALLYLPDVTILKTRPSKAATYGMLARVYLTMNDYPKASLYSDSCLNLAGDLMNYNNLDYSLQYPIPLFNAETIFYSKSKNGLLKTGQFFVDSSLLSTYDDNDLRKKAYFKEVTNRNFSFYGSYIGVGSLQTGNSLTGLATDEILLISAEAKIRTNQVGKGIENLNRLLVQRWKTSTFSEINITDADAALRLVLNERRKELIFRGLRWTDLRRLNTDDRFKVTLIRDLNGVRYTLAPGSLLYTLPIPNEVISANPGMVQNPRN